MRGEISVFAMQPIIYSDTLQQLSVSHTRLLFPVRFLTITLKQAAFAYIFY